VRWSTVCGSKEAPHGLLRESSALQHILHAGLGRRGRRLVDVHSLSRAALKVPGARRVFKMITALWGEGWIYTIRSGPMKDLKWCRENRFPYWYHTGRYEPEISRLVAATLKPGNTYWDIGAHAGYHTLQGARAVGSSGMVLAVEPDPSVCRSLQRQLALNGFTNVTLVQTAVSDRPGIARLVIRAADDTRTSALDTVHNPVIRNSRGLRIEVPSMTLDQLAERYPPAHLLKMDIEGSECAALQGAGRLWEAGRRPRHVLLSCHGREARDFCERLLLEHGYRLRAAPGLSGTVVAVDGTQEMRSSDGSARPWSSVERRSGSLIK
jgi:FkbM family methyltransferase